MALDQNQNHSSKFHKEDSSSNDHYDQQEENWNLQKTAGNALIAFPTIIYIITAISLDPTNLTLDSFHMRRLRH